MSLICPEVYLRFVDGATRLATLVDGAQRILDFTEKFDWGGKMSVDREYLENLKFSLQAVSEKLMSLLFSRLKHGVEKSS